MNTAYVGDLSAEINMPATLLRRERRTGGFVRLGALELQVLWQIFLPRLNIGEQGQQHVIRCECQARWAG
jgi:hypothetical protein